MREAILLHYSPGSSVWHRHNPSLKLAELAFWSITLLAGNLPVLIVTGCVLFVGHIMAGSRLRRFRKPLFFWLIMATTITIFAGLSDNSSSLIVMGRSFPVGWEGLMVGGIRSLRLLAVLLAGQLLASSTDPADLAEALRRLTFFLPRNWSGALATAVSLTIRFIPQLMDEALAVRDAAFSRGLGQRRSIFRRALSMGLPLADATLRRADLTADALLSRCYTTEPSVSIPKIDKTDILLVFFAVVPSLITILSTMNGFSV